MTTLGIANYWGIMYNTLMVYSLYVAVPVVVTKPYLYNHMEYQTIKQVLRGVDILCQCRLQHTEMERAIC